jgi:hypothetical protein
MRTGRAEEKLQVKIYLTAAQHQQLKVIAAQNNVGMSDLIGHWIRAAADTIVIGVHGYTSNKSEAEE